MNATAVDTSRNLTSLLVMTLDVVNAAWMMEENLQFPTYLPSHGSVDSSSSISLDEMSMEHLLRLEEQLVRNWSSMTSSSHNNDNVIDVLHRPVVRVIVVIIYVIVVIVGLISNGIVLIVFARSRRLQTGAVTNIFIVSLALADLWLCVFCLPVQLHYQMTDKWVFGARLCRVIFASFAVPMYVSTLSVLLIAVDRHRLIVQPLRPRMTSHQALALLAIAVIVSVTMSIPIIYFTHLIVVDDDRLGLHLSYCVERWKGVPALLRRAYGVVTFLLQFLLPLVVTAGLYFRVYARLRSRPAGLQDSRSSKTNRLLLAIVACFFICWLPWNLLSLVLELDPNAVHGTYFRLIDLLLKAFALGSADINPVLYCWLNESFHAELTVMAIQLKLLNNSGACSGAVRMTSTIAGVTDIGVVGEPSKCRNNRLAVDRICRGSQSSLSGNFASQSKLDVGDNCSIGDFSDSRNKVHEDGMVTSLLLDNPGNHSPPGTTDDNSCDITMDTSY